MEHSDLLRVEGLTVGVGRTPIVEDISFAIAPGETVGVVGESGSGKSITGLAIVGLLPVPVRRTGGTVWFEGRNVTDYSERELRAIRGAGIGMIFQDPVRSLNPAFTVGEQIAEALRWHLHLSRRSAWAKAVEMLAEVGIRAPAQRAKEYPHMFSGGMRQRVGIAMALACRPKLLIADEPTTALDVTTQAQILELVKDLQRYQLSVILISHDISVVADACDRIIVMYAGQIIEEAAAAALLASPAHPYTESLLRCAAGAVGEDGRLATLAGAVPTPGEWPLGCRFNPRCPYVIGKCREQPPVLQSEGAGRRVRCHRAKELTLRGAA